MKFQILNFFIDPNGANDPLAELMANQQALKNESLIQDPNLRFSCQFPARALFLEKVLKIKGGSVCPDYQERKRHSFPDRIQFVHVAQFIGNPASAFGHSFLRFDNKYRSGLLGTSFSYSAQIETKDDPFSYAFKGLFGGYIGAYDFDDFYPKAHGYGTLENREVWEYELKLNIEQRERIFAHSWELYLNGQSDYFFLTKNCTYQLLKLIEVSNDDLQLISDKRINFITPMESLHILKNSHLIINQNRRAPMQEVAQKRYSNLDRNQKLQLLNFKSGRIPASEITDPKTSDAILAVLALGVSQEKTETIRSQFRGLAETRSRLPASESAAQNAEIQTVDYTNWFSNPLHSHSSGHLSFGYQKQNQSQDLVIEIRPALQDLLDRGQGFLANSQLIFLNTKISLNENRSAQIEKIDFLDIKSLPTSLPFESHISWNAALFYSRQPMAFCLECQQLNFKVQFGQTYSLDPKIDFFYLGGLQTSIIEMESRIQPNFGPLMTFGAIGKFRENIFLLAEPNIQYLFGEFQKLENQKNQGLFVVNPNIELRIHFSKTWSLGIEYEGQFALDSSLAQPTALKSTLRPIETWTGTLGTHF